MKKQFTDEQLDSLMRELISDASLDDAAVEDIAASPALWWSVQREIHKGKTAAVSPWPPLNTIRRWLMLGVPALAAVAIAIGAYVIKPAGNGVEVSRTEANTTAAAEFPAAGNSTAMPAVISPVNVETASVATAAKLRPTRAVAATVKARPRSLTPAPTRQEIKTEFIALSYARDPDSGQLVRVKVPSSMMVTLGLVSSVEKPQALVDAEVIVGDDGLTRAIRFIR